VRASVLSSEGPFRAQDMVVKLDVWSRYILTTESYASYVVVPADGSFSAAEVALADLRLHMWPVSGSGFAAERVDNLTRGLVDTCHRLEPIQCEAYPEGL